jgi:hypothetical protein
MVHVRRSRRAASTRSKRADVAPVIALRQAVAGNVVMELKCRNLDLIWQPVSDRRCPRQAEIGHLQTFSVAGQFVRNAAVHAKQRCGAFIQSVTPQTTSPAEAGLMLSGVC